MEKIPKSLKNLNPIVAEWFVAEIGSPTDVQERAWSEIEKGENVLISAPTGSGKTLAAFMIGINNFIDAKFEMGRTRILYVSPLKALNNDIQRNLKHPLGRLKNAFEWEGLAMPDIRVLTRSGDTPQNERAKMRRSPPEILITTPESLHIMLTSRGGRSMLGDLALVILDEVHAVFGNKRGVLLSSAIERLTDLSGDFQRIGLSATVNPIATVAKFVGGYAFDSLTGNFTARHVSVVKDESSKAYNLSVFFPAEKADEAIWEPIIKKTLEHIDGNRSTLLFANSRRLAETITKRINDSRSEITAYPHHGAMSREIREEVEHRFKNGELKAIVATNTLEMGIDIGDLDEVLMVQCPSEVSGAIQRVGRSKHQVGATSKALFLPTHAHDILEATVLVAAIKKGVVEEMRPTVCPLDVLAQIVISIVAHQKMSLDDLFNQIRRSYSYRELSRQNFDLVLEMLSGRYKTSRIRELRARVLIDKLDNTIQLMPNAEMAIYNSGGVIPDRGYYKLRLGTGGTVLGELDEEFVWEAEIGKKFAFGNQAWQIEKITHNDVVVSKMESGKPALPFWKGEGINRSFHYSDLIGRFVEEANGEIQVGKSIEKLCQNLGLSEGAYTTLETLLISQSQVTGQALPHRHHILVEQMESGSGGVPGNQVVIHNFWGNRINYPYSLALKGALEDRYGYDVEMYPHNNCLVLILSDEIEPETLMGLVTPENLDRYLRLKLESSEYFGARFRECAGRALLIERRRIGERMPLFMSRLRAKELMGKVMKYEDFPILLEGWRSCFQDEFEMGNLRMLLAELDRGEIAWSVARTMKPSPFAEVVSWRQVNQYMYAGDAVKGDAVSNLSDELIGKLIESEELRPVLPESVVDEFVQKRQLLYDGYSPRNDVELLGVLKERVVFRKCDLDCLLRAMERDQGVMSLGEILDKKIFEIRPGLYAVREVEAEAEAICLGEGVNGVPFEESFCEWLSYWGPMSKSAILDILPLAEDTLDECLRALLEDGLVVNGDLVIGQGDVFCERQNYEILLRINRRHAQPDFEPFSLSWLPAFLAEHHGLVKESQKDLYAVLDRLICYPLDPTVLESDILAVRDVTYRHHQLDAILQENALGWLGNADKKILFYYKNELDLLGEALPSKKKSMTEIFQDFHAKYDYGALVQRTGLPSNKLVPMLWDSVWAGQITNDGYDVLRKGIQAKFKAPKVSQSRHRGGLSLRRSKRAEWGGQMPLSGNWHLLPSYDSGDNDLVSAEEVLRERVRLLFGRYGILFRDILKNEVNGFQWSDIFRTLRLMELSGEILTGYFFEGISGPQFITPSTWSKLKKGFGTGSVFWMNAQDPASLCGIVTGLSLPSRIKTTHVMFCDDRVVLVSRRMGRTLEFSVSPSDPLMHHVNQFFLHFLTREASPMQKIAVDLINGQSASESDFLEVFEASFEVRRNGKGIFLFRKRW